MKSWFVLFGYDLVHVFVVIAISWLQHWRSIRRFLQMLYWLCISDMWWRLHEKASSYYMFDSNNKVVKVGRAVLSGVEILKYVAKCGTTHTATLQRPTMLRLWWMGGSTLQKATMIDYGGWLHPSFEILFTNMERKSIHRYFIVLPLVGFLFLLVWCL